ncbi:hypothetical protein [Streptomyces diastatochromogenes]|uniref:DUF7919 domain-containing protein n=1 Tax=Streptomyces diastatochromogenes TaxID=42236 RepID=A0A233RZY3_STRDA|nr:hypothetical protein [Streptomyces diastatochromogenes]MCZ0990755.1 hypothetical protein [Streptomyces diastatochromogenes]OXY88919.1 hypothetical protein BEK98_39535 [Streptomyces diastatochromogenes]
MFYEDLSPYAYWDEGDQFSDVTDGMRFVSFRPLYARLNVGWLEAGRPWSSGPAPQDFTDRLLAILGAQEVNAMLGLHACDLCATPLPDSHPWYVPRPGHLRASAGTGEIRVPGPRGTAFAAPLLIGHYVADHGYLPPRPFIDAVFAFDPYGPWPARFPGIRFPWIPDDAVLRHVDEE